MVNINTIKDTILALAQSLRVETIFPAILLVLVHVYWILPGIIDFDPASTPTVTLCITVTLTLSYAFYAFNFPLIRLLEGYKLQDADFMQKLLEYQRSQFNQKYQEIKRLRGQYSRLSYRLEHGHTGTTSPSSPIKAADWEELQKTEFKLCTQEAYFDYHFPAQIQAVLPTPLGNIIAAFEDYPRTRYGIDSVTLWPRLLPILRETKFIDFVAQEKAVFDFLLNMGVVVAFVGIELIYLYMFRVQPCRAAIVAVIMLITLIILHQGLLVAARQWGTTVRTAFDLHRHDLQERLGLRPAVTFKEEYQRWQNLSTFLSYRYENVWFDEFLPQTAIKRGKGK